MCIFTVHIVLQQVRRAWKYQMGNQNQYIEDGQTTQWSKEKYKMTNNDLVMTDSVPLRKNVNTVQYIKIITGNCEYCFFILQLCDFEH
jgi:hypothetical protein